MSPEPSLDPHDVVGAETLERMATAPAFHLWMFDRLERWIGNRVIEVGSGIGNISKHLVGRERVALTDTDAGYLERLRATYGDRREVLKWIQKNQY